MRVLAVQHEVAQSPGVGEPTYNVYNSTCPSRAALARIGDKWTALIVGLLAERPHRFGELLRKADGISQKTLTGRLRGLVRDGLVDRRAFATVPVTVEYSLTPAGETLIEPLAALRDWTEVHIGAILAAHRGQGE